MNKKYDVPFDSDFPANDTAHMYAEHVVNEVLERFQDTCTRFEHAPDSEPRDDKAPRVYGGEEEDDEPSILPGELLIGFNADLSVNKFYFRTDEPVTMPENGTFMRIACGTTIRDAADAAARIDKAAHVRTPRHAAGDAAAAAEPARGAAAGAVAPPAPDPAAAAAAAAARKAQLSAWHATVVRLAREQSVTSAIYTGPCVFAHKAYVICCCMAAFCLFLTAGDVCPSVESLGRLHGQSGGV